MCTTAVVKEIRNAVLGHYICTPEYITLVFLARLKPSRCLFALFDSAEPDVSQVRGTPLVSVRSAFARPGISVACVLHTALKTL